MKNYHYHGINQKGNKLQGMIVAVSKSEAAMKLLSMGIRPHHIRMETDSGIKYPALDNFFIKNKIPLDELSLFFSQLYSIARSNIPMIDGLRSICSTHSNKKFVLILQNIIFNLESGFSITDAFHSYQSIFGGYPISLIAMGEKTSNMAYAFEQIKNHYEEEIKTRRQIWQAIRYPLVVMFFIIVAVLIVNWVVVPSFQQFFSAFSAKLPWQTQVLMQSSYFFMHHSHFLLLAILVALGAIRYANTKVSGKLFFDRLKFHIPFVGGILAKIWVCRFCLQLANALHAQVPMLSAIQTISSVSDNQFFTSEIDKIRTRIELGESFALAIKHSALFEPLVIQMILMGEQTGTLAEALEGVVAYYQKEIQYRVSELSGRMEPILITFVAGFVLLLALGVFLPMWDISSVALGKY
ncbi:MAG: type II secretion system F family protein [Candidatus Berkiella sp.]